MNRLHLFHLLMFSALLAACGFARTAAAQSPGESPSPRNFAEHVNLTALGEVAVHTEGRVKSLDSFARATMQYVTGARKIDGHSPTFTYLDMMLRSAEYVEKDGIFVKNKPMRARIAQALRQSLADLEANASTLEGRKNLVESGLREFTKEREAAFMKTGLIAPALLSHDRVGDLMVELSADVVKTAKFVEALDLAFKVMDPNALRANLKLVAPPAPEGGFDDPWFTLDELGDPHSTNPQLAALDPTQRGKLVDQWSAFTKAWQEQNAAGVNDAAAQLAALLPAINPAVYPEPGRLSWESWYFRMHNMTWVWILYALALIPLLLSVVFRWPAARWLGVLMFLTAFGFHTFAVMLRWYVADRWPNSNMFEAVTTAAWFGGCCALLFELFLRRKPMRSFFALGSAVASMFALMAVHFLPLELNANISNKMPVLNDVWLYIHTNVIIFSYCLIFIAAVTAALYLLYRLVALLRGVSASNEYAKVGGAASLILTKPDGSQYLSEGKSSLGQVLDGTTMVVMEMSFILLWTGLVMGAIWADHSWGRPWGWDPKEVFALNTFIVFLILVHGRMKVKDKGLWTAAMALIGAVVMLFNWIIINFAISGLHSYA